MDDTGFPNRFQIGMSVLVQFLILILMSNVSRQLNPLQFGIGNWRCIETVVSCIQGYFEFYRTKVVTSSCFQGS